MNDDESGFSNGQTMEAISALADAVAIFAISLDPEGMTKASAFAALLMDFRKCVEPDSVKEAVIDQVLHNLAGDGVESLLRRQRFRLVTAEESHGAGAIPESPGSSGQEGI